MVLQIDVCSEDFNPLRALYEPNITIASSKPKAIYQNIAALESAFRKFGIWKLNHNNRGMHNDNQIVTVGSERNHIKLVNEVRSRRFLPHQMPLDRLSKSSHCPRNILLQMSVSEGPSSRLRFCVAEHLRIRVIIRKRHFIRGSMEGRLIIFDKHWNLILSDVTETWERRKNKFGQNKWWGYSENCQSRLQKFGIPRDIKSLNRKNIEVTRKLPLVLVRGEHIVSVVVQGTCNNTGLCHYIR